VPDDQDLAGMRPTGSEQSPALSPELLVALRAAFAGEADRRLPRLRRLQQHPGPQVLEQALRDAHSLASSAAIVGAADVARCAARVEAGLERCLRDPAPGLPAPVAADAEQLTALLDCWLHA